MESLESTYPLLCSTDPTRALHALRLWCDMTDLPIIRSELLQLPQPARASISSAVLDLLSNYPTVRFAVPLLIYYRSEAPALAATACLAAGNYRSLRQILNPRAPVSAAVLSNRVQAGLLEVQSADQEPPDLPSDWCQQFFLDIPPGTTVHVSSGRLLPWPAAVEAAQVMMSAALAGHSGPCNNVWLSDVEWSAATDCARLFRAAIAESNQSEQRRYCFATADGEELACACCDRPVDRCVCGLITTGLD